ncbi:hypothetical protein GCM10009864_72510 [Streptomyces lunalinharesii]|uniref:Uncharacterized protein n=1 Tax=Streptomyces lunalinharesii TaxID=333384 RepID=A0ABN3SWW9_9ACTN
MWGSGLLAIGVDPELGAARTDHVDRPLVKRGKGGAYVAPPAARHHWRMCTGVVTGAVRGTGFFAVREQPVAWLPGASGPVV